VLDDDIRSKRMKDNVRDAQAGFDTSSEEDARLRQESPSGPNSKGSGAFYGDIGTTFSGPAREDMQKQDGDPEKEYEEFSNLPKWAALHATKYGLQDLGKRTRFAEYLSKKETGELEPKKPQEPKEEPMLSRAADDKFWNSDEPKKFTTKKL